MLQSTFQVRWACACCSIFNQKKSFIKVIHLKKSDPMMLIKFKKVKITITNKVMNLFLFLFFCKTSKIKIYTNYFKWLWMESNASARPAIKKTNKNLFPHRTSDEPPNSTSHLIITFNTYLHGLLTHGRWRLVTQDLLKTELLKVLDLSQESFWKVVLINTNSESNRACFCTLFS